MMDDREKLRKEFNETLKDSMIPASQLWWEGKYKDWLEDKVTEERRHIEEQNLIKQAWIDANKILIKQNKELEETNAELMSQWKRLVEKGLIDGNQKRIK